MPADFSPLLILCNCPDEACAQGLAQALVEARLAACVNILPACQSVYRWQGAVESATEIPLLIKSTVRSYPALEALIRQQHPYALPEIIALPITHGLPAYLDWLRAESTPA